MKFRMETDVSETGGEVSVAYEVYLPTSHEVFDLEKLTLDQCTRRNYHGKHHDLLQQLQPLRTREGLYSRECIRGY